MVVIFDLFFGGTTEREYWLDPDKISIDESYYAQQILRWGSVTGEDRDEKWVEEVGYPQHVIDDVIIPIVEQSMRRQDTQLRQAVPLKLKVCLALYHLRRKDSYQTTAKVFGVSSTFAKDTFIEFCRVLRR